MFVASLLAAVFVAFTAQTPPPNTAARDFAIRFEFGLCWRDVVNTGTDSYLRDLANGETRTVSLRLTAAQRHQLAAWVLESRFFELPAEMDASITKDGRIQVRITSEVYRFDIQNSGMRNVVEFDDNGDSTSEPVRRVRALAERLKHFFTELPQVKKLPKPAVGRL